MVISPPASIPRRLERGDVVTGFVSGAAELDNWLERFAWENQRANNAVTYVTTAVLPGVESASPAVIGYYSVAVAGVALSAVPADMLKGSRPDPLPCILLARLAVDQRMRGKGLGPGLLADALERSVLISESVGAAAVLVHARDEQARNFYLKNGDWLQSPVEPLHLMAPMKVLKRLFGTRG
ncbi:MAG TPA: GNAT family N-acetyltransferase [Propionibacteriaceae bacterium]